VGFDNVWHADGSSPYTQAVDILVEDYHKTWVAAAGNENQRYRIGDLSDAGDDVVAIDGMSPVWIASSGGWAVASLRWSEPMGEASVDLDLYLFDEDGNPCTSATQGVDLQDGDDHPYEIAECHTSGAWAQAWVVANGNDVTGLEGYLYAYGGLDEADATPERNLTLPGDTRLGISVGAVDLPDTSQVASYSSRGPTEDGEMRPHLVAPAGVSTASYGASLFSGTSAATPHVTGVAALLLHADRLGMDPADVRDYLTSATTDIGPAGADHASGAGFLTPDAVPWRGCHCAQVPHGPAHGPWAWLLIAASGAFLRRRRIG
jgi:MYXO-CTERM domain-containing protein